MPESFQSVVNDRSGAAQNGEIRVLAGQYLRYVHHREVITIELGQRHGMNVVGAAMLSTAFQISSEMT